MAEVTCIADGLGFPEGPILLKDGGLLVLEIPNGQLTRIEPGGRMTVFAQLGGGPNGAALAPDENVINCNNGGFSWHQGDRPTFPAGAASDYISGSIQKVDLNAVGPAAINIAFGGEDMRDAYLTASAAECVYHMRCSRSGLRLH